MTLVAAQSDQMAVLDTETCAIVDDVGMLIYDGETAHLLRGDKQHFEIPEVPSVRITHPEYVTQLEGMTLYKWMRDFKSRRTDQLSVTSEYPMVTNSQTSLESLMRGCTHNSLTR